MTRDRLIYYPAGRLTADTASLALSGHFSSSLHTSGTYVLKRISTGGPAERQEAATELSADAAWGERSRADAARRPPAAGRRRCRPGSREPGRPRRDTTAGPPAQGTLSPDSHPVTPTAAECPANPALHVPAGRRSRRQSWFGRQASGRATASPAASRWEVGRVARSRRTRGGPEHKQR